MSFPAPGPTGQASAFADELYRRTLPLAARDAENDMAWLVLCTALAAMFDPVDTIVRDLDEGPGYSSLLDLERAPSEALGWLAMFGGVVAIKGLPDREQRARIDATEGIHRGTPAAIITAATKRLTGTRRTSLEERYQGDPYAYRVVTYASETPDPAGTLADLLAAKPVGLTLIYDVLPGWVIDEMEAYYEGVTIAAGPETDYAKLIDYESRI